MVGSSPGGWRLGVSMCSLAAAMVPQWSRRQASRELHRSHEVEGEGETGVITTPFGKFFIFLPSLLPLHLVRIFT